MAQTNEKANIRLPKGAKVSAKKSGSATWVDLGAIEADIAANLEWTDVEVLSGNAGKVLKFKKDMKVTGSFNLINLDQEGLEEISGGLFERVVTLGSPNSTILDQTIPANWDDNKKYELIAYTSSSDSKELRFSTKPTLTSVTLDATVDETLTENDDYVILADPSASSGWSIQFMSAGMTTGTPKANPIIIDYGTNTPIASTTIYCGADTAEFAAYALKFTVTAENGTDVEDELELYSTSTNSGAFNFGYKGAFSDGVDMMPISFTADVDTSKTSGRQLLAWTKAS